MGLNQAALGSNLLCYQVNFQPTQLGAVVTLNPSMTLGELFDQARRASAGNKAAGLRSLATVLRPLNGNDTQGCSRRWAVGSFVDNCLLPTA